MRLDRLRALISESVEQTQRGRRLTELAKATQAELAATIELVRAARREAVIEEVNRNRGKEIMDEARTGVAAINDQVDLPLSARTIRSGWLMSALR
jgi:CHASE3 domain sensor protein